MKVLVVEDEHKIANSIKKGLEQEGFMVDVAFDGSTGYDLASDGTYDIILLDLMLPRMNGIEICKSLRKDGVHTPILMLTAKGELQDKVEGLNSGADDYLTKPFAFEELLARLKAIVRRPPEPMGEVLKCDNLTLNTLTYEVQRGKEIIALSRKEYSLLEYLLRHKNKTFSKDQLIERVWSYEADVLPNTVEVYIGYLRKKIDGAFPNEVSLIHTVRGFGYKLARLE